MLLSSAASAVVRYVDLSNTNPLPPYTGWSTAATNIQDAINASTTGDTVVVTNGIYGVGGKSIDGVITNRVALDKALTVQSVNGPDVTIIQGSLSVGSTNGPDAVRCVWLTNNATLMGFTLRGGATRSVTGVTTESINGGGVWGASTSAVASNCIIIANFASDKGGGAYQVTLNNCTLIGNHAVGSGVPGSGVANAGSGGGAANSILRNCFVISNFADQSNGGGVDNCRLRNCSLVRNSSFMNGGAVNGGSLANCTVTGNTSSGYSSGYGSAVYGAKLTNCIVWGNLQRTSNLNTNFGNCTLVYCCTEPLATGNGNINVDPQILSDGVHVSQTSLCRVAGTNSIVAGADIDGQPWSNPPTIGCDEWLPEPVIGAQPNYQAGLPFHGLTFNVFAAGQEPFDYFWNKDGGAIHDDAHYINSGTANLIVNNFGPDDAGLYQVVASNSFGTVTSQLAQVAIHVVDAAGSSPFPPYSTWATAATNIQDAINIAAHGEIVLVTNGVYATGGKVMAGDLTNRVALDKPVTVISVNGYKATVIQGAWDTASMNGPGAVRCAWLTDGAVLSGFTLQKGATRSSGNTTSLQTGGGVWCVSTDGVVSNCLLTNNSAIYGGGISYGTLNNSLVVFNLATYGGGAFYATLNNCTVMNNYTTTSFPSRGAGTYEGITRNSIVVGNFDNYLFYPLGFTEDNYAGLAQYSHSCTSPTKSGDGNINGFPQQFDLFHILSTSPCRFAGSPAYASGTDLDGEPWVDSPSMGCDEVIPSNLVGPLSVSLLASQTNLLVNRSVGFGGIISGRASRVEWSFGDGPVITNLGVGVSHQWTNSGDYNVMFTAYNFDIPAGVSTNTIIYVQQLDAPQVQSALLMTNGFQFQFSGQLNARYTVQYTTNLTPPVAWQTLQTIFNSGGGTHQISDATAPTGTRFYRVLVQ